jgi:hypothetical protein
MDVEHQLHVLASDQRDGMSSKIDIIPWMWIAEMIACSRVGKSKYAIAQHVIGLTTGVLAHAFSSRFKQEEVKHMSTAPWARWGHTIGRCREVALVNHFHAVHVSLGSGSPQCRYKVP